MSKIKDAVSFFIKNDNKKIKIIICIGLLGILLISMSELFKSDTETQTDETQSFDYSQYTEQTEEKLTDIISSIDGVGECRVMITFENTNESVYATDNEEKSESDGESSKDEYVFYDSGDGETPVLIKEIYPSVLGVSVVCSGGDSIEVKEAVINTVTSLFDISANRVSVTKISS